MKNTISRPTIKKMEDGRYKIEIFDKELNSGYLIDIGGYDNAKVGYVHRIDVHRFDKDEVKEVNLETGEQTEVCTGIMYAIKRRDKWDIGD